MKSFCYLLTCVSSRMAAKTQQHHAPPLKATWPIKSLGTSASMLATSLPLWGRSCQKAAQLKTRNVLPLFMQSGIGNLNRGTSFSVILFALLLKDSDFVPPQQGQVQDLPYGVNGWLLFQYALHDSSDTRKLIAISVKYQFQDVDLSAQVLH